MSESLRPQIGLLRFGCALLLAGAASLVSGVRAEAQEAQMTAGVSVDGKTPIDVANLVTNLKLANQLRSVVVPIMQVGKADGQQQLSNFDLFVIFRIAELTLPPTDAKDTVERRRQKIKSTEILRITGNANIPQDLHERANQLMIANLVPLIGNAQYSMDARYNAMLLLGMLDKVEPDAAAARPAVPLDSTEPILLQAAKTATLPEILRIGALVGLARHCDLQLAGTHRAAIAAEALALLSAKVPPSGFSANGFHWARKQAIAMVMGLAKTGSETSQPPFIQALQALLADESQPLFLRRDAALAFGYVDPAAIAAGSVKPDDICKAIANLTLAVTKAGTPRFDPTAPVDLSKPEDVFQTPNEDNKVRFAEGVAYYLNCIATGLGGRIANRGLIKGINGADPTFARVNDLLNKHVNPLVTALSKPNPDSNRLLSDLEQKRGPLEEWMRQNQLVAGPGGGANIVPAGNGAPAGAGGALGAPRAP
ncbi:MAG: hypothetical protein C0483_03950 [Pirellula sp.]|nr:hypothetical protein [Pirellula sp.]